MKTIKGLLPNFLLILYGYLFFQTERFLRKNDNTELIVAINKNCK